MDLVEEVYRLTAILPASERWRLVDQLSRAAVSVPANVAEGQGRATTKDFGHFLAIAKGSVNEVETYLHLAIRLGYLEEHAVAIAFGLATEVSKMLTSLRRQVVSGRP
jgi:four helix bundle protein